MNKLFVPLVAIAALAACEKTDDLARHQHEVTVIAKYYLPILDADGARLKAVVDRIGHVAPGAIGQVGVQLKEAQSQIARLHSLVVPTGDGRSTIELEADKKAKAGEVEEVIAIADRAHEQLERGTIEIERDLGVIEGFAAQLEVKTALVAQAAPPAAPTTPPATPAQPDEPALATPEAATP